MLVVDFGKTNCKDKSQIKQEKRVNKKVSSRNWVGKII